MLYIEDSMQCPGYTGSWSKTENTVHYFITVALDKTSSREKTKQKQNKNKNNKNKNKTLR